MIVSGESQLKDSLSEAIAHNVIFGPNCQLVIEKTNENGKKILKMPNAHEALAIFSKDDWEDDEEG
jgi:PHD/YefM family antitoxin component YafN of YafNO toxin-antitoxin module